MSQQGAPLLVLSVAAVSDIARHRAVTFGGAQVSVRGSLMQGIARRDARVGDDCDVVASGTAIWETGEALPAGTQVETDSSGRACRAIYGPAVGVTMQDAAVAGSAVEVMLTPSSLSREGSAAVIARMTEAKGRSLTSWADGTLVRQSGGAGEAFALDNGTMFGGEPMVRCTLSTTPGAVFQGRITLTAPIYVGDIKTLQIPLMVASNRAEAMSGALVQVWLYTTGGVTLRVQVSCDSLMPGVVHLLSVNQQTALGGSATWTALQAEAINRIEVVITAGTAAAGLYVWVGRISASARKVGRLNICLDGCYTQQRDYILPLLDRYGLKCSMPITTAQLGQSGRMSEAEILAAYANGHDLIHHTFGNWSNGWDNATTYPDAASITADVVAQWAWLDARGATRGIGHCVTPFTDAFAATVPLARQQLIRDALIAAAVKSVRIAGRRNPNTSIYPSSGSLHSIGDARRTFLQYSGGVMLGYSAPASALTLSSASVGGATATAANSFSPYHKGQYVVAGTGGGYARITSVTDASNVGLDIRRAFSGTNFAAGAWARGDSGQTVRDLIDAAEEYGEMATVTIHRAMLTSGALLTDTLTQYVDDMAEWIEYAAVRQRAGGIVVQKIADIVDSAPAVS